MTKSAIKHETTACVNKLEGWINARLSYMDGGAVTVKRVTFENDEKLYQYLDGAISNEQSFASDIYIGDKDGWFVDGTGWIPDADWTPADRDWFITGIASDKTVVSADVSLDIVTSEIETMNVMDNGQK